MASESKDTAKEGSNVYHPKDSEEFEKYIALGDYTLVDFSTSWCGPCKRIWPEIEKLAKEHSNVNVVKVDCEELEAVAQEYGVKSFPTFKFMNKGKVVATVMGANLDNVKAGLANLLKM